MNGDIFDDENNGIERYVSIENRRRTISKNMLKKAKRKKRRQLILKTLVVCTGVTFLAMIVVTALFLRDHFNDNNADEPEVTYVAPTTVPEPIPTKEPESEEEETVKIDKFEEQQCFESEMLSVKSTPTSISMEWVDADLGAYYVLYRQVTDTEEKHGKSSREDNSASMSSICTAVFDASDTGEEVESNGWIKRSTKENKIVLGGLEPDSTYHIHIIYEDKSLGQYEDVFDVTTSQSGYCDPFKAAYSLLRISERDESTGAIINLGSMSSVQMTSDSGCEGAVVKPMFESDLFSSSSRDERVHLGTVPKGCKLVVTADERGKYCSYDGTGYKLYVRSEDKKYEGWIEARNVLVDMNKIFSVDKAYSMQFDRTNAYSSIFTAGGDAQNVDTGTTVDENGEVVSTIPEVTIDAATGQEVPFDPATYPDTRYNPLLSDGNLESYMSTTGYNVIDGITGQALSNYESKDYMPVIWDLALELKQCQKNALENGYTIKMYEGYRPLSTSQSVYNSLNGSGVLGVIINNTNLAQGYITSQAYNVGNYIGYRSRHNRGVATDLTIVRLISDSECGEEAHMQTKMHTLDFRCNMAYNTWEADLLTDIMIGHDSHLEYLGLRQEWWHFQLKNSRKDLYPLVETYGYEDFVF